MKAAIIGIVAILGILGLVIFGNQSKPNDSGEELTFSTIQASLDNGGHLYDVRTAEEYANGHIQGAELHSLQDLQAGDYPDVAKDTDVYVYCRSGNRSGQATTILEDAGYTNVVDLGAITAVEAMGGTTTTE